jgi:hypothetical protein
MNLSAVVLPCAAEYLLGRDAFNQRLVLEALQCFNRAEAQGYNADECASARWHCWMLLGLYQQAWQESDAIAARSVPDPHRLWDQTSFEGKHIVIRCLHGLGDAIQFVRYAQLLRNCAASITVETHGELISLFSTVPWLDRVVSWSDGSSRNLTGWDQQIEVMELPRAFDTTLETVPAAGPYLHVDPAARERSKLLLGPAESRFRVGVVWRSSEWNPARSVPAAELAPVASLPGISLYSFQRGPGRAELSALRQHAPIRDTAEHSRDIADTAADLTNMDLLITVDTMAAHLAGALGRPVWTMLPFDADWRWMLDTSITPWYPTMTLYRQSQPGDWAGVIQPIVTDLKELICCDGGAREQQLRRHSLRPQSRRRGQDAS